MRRTEFTRVAAPAAAVLTALLCTTSCGNADSSSGSTGSSGSSSGHHSSSSAKVDTSTAQGTWLLGLTTAGGADGEKSTSVYISYDPSTGQASLHRLPGVTGASADPQAAALLVSSDRRWAIPDTGISHKDASSGKLTVYSLTGSASKVIDLRARSGQHDLKPIGWAFDPQRPDTLRVVDTANRVWAVSVAGGKATQEGSLAKGPWVFTNGFNRNTGVPYMESIDSDKTNPAGNGTADKSPVTRDGGAVLAANTAAYTQLPKSPCRLGAGFTDANGVTWTFCADKASLTTYYLPKNGTAWKSFGKPSTPVAPEASAFSLVLPPPTA